VSWHQGFRTEPPKDKPVAVIDIGSNSVRLVVYDGLRRSPYPLFNEKVLCGLGKGIAITSKMDEVAVTRALAALRRFRALIKQIGCDEVFALATAAAREASNGKDFITAAEKMLGSDITILTGKEEARYAALGVIASIPDADGVVGDLGGGSLELINVQDSQLFDGVTLPLGPLRLIDMSADSITKARKIVDEYLDKANVLETLKDRTFYAVGGTWRNLARLHLNHMKYPLHVLHQYTMARQGARDISELVSNLSPGALRSVKDISRSRLNTLPYGALVLERIVERGKPKRVVTSVYGVREGMLFAKLSRKKSELDPLLASCWDFARRYARSPQHELELCDWTDQLFGAAGLKETDDERKLRHAACLLADIGWRAHPDYRADRSLGMISQAAFVGVDHPGRVFLALTIFYRYEGEEMPDRLTSLLNEQQMRRAHLLSSLFRLAYILSAAMPGMLPKIGLELSAKTLTLSLPSKLKDLMGERVEKRLASLAGELDRSPKVSIG
jgi:exopolyphosphatase / guanosine-5'-triphosphate,3'-diphosphate pyrophosphatase